MSITRIQHDNNLPSSTKDQAPHIPTWWYASFGGELGKLERRQRRRLRGLHHDRVTGGEARGHLPREHHEGIVPGCHEATDADRLLARDREISIRPGVIDGHR